MTTGPSGSSPHNVPVFGELPRSAEVLVFGAPRTVLERLRAERPDLSIAAKPLAGVYASRPSRFVAGFCFLQSELIRAVPAFRRLLLAGGDLWVFRPAESAWDAEGIRPGMGITDASVRACAAGIGLAEAEACTLDAVWRGMRLVPAG